MAKKREDLPGIVQQCLYDFEEDSKHHDVWIEKVDKWYKAWRGYLDFRSDAARWRHRFHPPYILQIIETLVAGVTDPNPQWKVRPRPRMATPDEQQQLVEGAKALEMLLAYQRDQDQMVLSQRAHRLQGLIAGLTVWKTRWDYADEPSLRQEMSWQEGEDGMWVKVTNDIQERNVIKDAPCAEVIDVRDFIWPESARSIPEASRLYHRSWVDIEHLKDLEAAGIYKNVSEIGETRDFSKQLDSRESELFSVDRTKDKVEVLECWIENGKRVVTIANREVLLRDKKNPFDHGQFPFIACSPIPDLFRIPGVSVVELVSDLQEMLWTLQVQRLDNLEILNNAIVLVPESTIDPSQFVFAPGEVWLTESKDAVGILDMPQFPADVSLNAEGLIKQDIQNIPGASPALLGQASETTQTATEISLLTNLAQRRLASQKFQFSMADTLVGEQWIELNKQFLSEDQYVSVVGIDGEEGWALIHPEQFRDGNFFIEIEQMDESLIRQEKLAEAQARLQIAAQVMPMMIGGPVMLNIPAFVEDVLEAAGVKNKARYFTQSQLPALPQGGMSGGPPSPTQGSNGATAPQAVDQNSPSNQFSQSPAAMMHRMQAMGGGPVNA